jgi:hypothetical protein
MQDNPGRWVSCLACLKGQFYRHFQGAFLKQRDSGGMDAHCRSYPPFHDRYCMNHPWLTTADWPLCTVVLAAA